MGLANWAVVVELPYRLKCELEGVVVIRPSIGLPPIGAGEQHSSCESHHLQPHPQPRARQYPNWDWGCYAVREDHFLGTGYKESTMPNLRDLRILAHQPISALMGIDPGTEGDSRAEGHGFDIFPRTGEPLRYRGTLPVGSLLARRYWMMIPEDQEGSFRQAIGISVLR